MGALESVLEADTDELGDAEPDTTGTDRLGSAEALCTEIRAINGRRQR